VSREETARISIENLRRIIRSIHRQNPQVLVVVLGVYPDERMTNGGWVPNIVDQSLVPLTDEINWRVRDALASEPRTVFASFHFPPNINMFQSKNPGHPNCRGARIMANAVVDALFSAGELQNGLAAAAWGCHVGAIREPCSMLPSKACCMRSAVCALHHHSGKCFPYTAEVYHGIPLPR